MKSILKSLLSLFVCMFILSACSSGASAPSDPLDGTYYCQRLFVYDTGTNMREFYNSENLGSENTTLTITDGKTVNYTYYYHGTEEKSLQGSLRDTTEGDNTLDGKVFFEGDSTEYTLACEFDPDSGKPKTISLVYPFGSNGNYMGLSFSDTKRDAITGTYDDLEDTENKLSDFENSDVYQQVTAYLEKTYGDFDHTLTYDSDNYELNLVLRLDGLKNGIDQSSDVNKSFGELCDALDTISTSVQTVINAGGYKGISFILHFDDGSSTLYASENGTRTYTYTPKETIAAAPAPSATPAPSTAPAATTTSTSFKDSSTFAEIKRLVSNAFPDSNPQITYREKDNMLTVVLTGGKNWEDAILNDSKTYSAWLSYTSDLLDLSASGYDVLCDEGYPEIAFTIMVVSYDDSDKALYACMNGTPFYDFTQE